MLSGPPDTGEGNGKSLPVLKLLLQTLTLGAPVAKICALALRIAMGCLSREVWCEREEHYKTMQRYIFKTVFCD